MCVDCLAADDGSVDLVSILLLESCCNLRFLVGVICSEEETGWFRSGRSVDVSIDLFSPSSKVTRTRP